MQAGVPRTTSVWPLHRTSRAHSTVESFQRRMHTARPVGREFLGTGEQNTHLHKLAFQMRMLLMRDLGGTGQLLGGRQVPGIESRSRQVARFPVPRSPFPQSLQAEPTHLRPGEHRKHRGLGHLLATRSTSTTGPASPPCRPACLPEGSARTGGH